MRAKDFLRRELGAVTQRLATTPHPTLHDLDEYLHQNLTEVEAEALRDHLEVCASCVEALLDFEAFLAAVVEPVAVTDAEPSMPDSSGQVERLPNVKVLEVERVWQKLRTIVQEGVPKGGGNGFLIEARGPLEEGSTAVQGKRRSGPASHGRQESGQGNEEKTRLR